MTLYIKEGRTLMTWTTPGSQLVAEHWSTYKSHWTHERNYSTSHIKHFGLVLPSSNPPGRKCSTYPLRWPDTFKSSPWLKKACGYCSFLQRGEQLLLSTAALHVYLQHRNGAPLLRYCNRIRHFLLWRVQEV